MNASVVDACAKVPGLCGIQQRRHMEWSPGGDLVETSNTKGASSIMTKQQISRQLQRLDAWTKQAAAAWKWSETMNSKMTRRERRAPHLARAVAAIGATVTMAAVLVLTSTPANAASSMTIRHQVTKPGLLRHQIDVHLPMSQEDAAGYIWNGARIIVTCYGDDWFDDLLPDVPRPGYTGPATYTGNPGPGQPGQTGILTAHRKAFT